VSARFAHTAISANSTARAKYITPRDGHEAEKKAFCARQRSLLRNIRNGSICDKAVCSNHVRSCPENDRIADTPQKFQSTI
jgi:hypothetical protein